MTQNLSIDADRINLKVAYWGMALNLFIPAVLVGLGLFLKSKGMQATPTTSIGLFLVILLAAGIGQIGIILVIRKTLLGLIAGRAALPKQISLEQSFIRYSIIIFLLSLAPCIYGFIYLLLGGTMDWFLIFVAITLLCFMFFRPRPGQVRRLISQTDDSRQS